jgi:hypothetical protein
MEKSYREGVATTLTPSHARAGRKDALEALDIHDKDLSRENTHPLGLIGRISGEAAVAGLTVCLDLPNWIR